MRVKQVNGVWRATEEPPLSIPATPSGKVLIGYVKLGKLIW